jgi:hypothetical protein
MWWWLSVFFWFSWSESLITALKIDLLEEPYDAYGATTVENFHDEKSLLTPASLRTRGNSHYH